MLGVVAVALIAVLGVAIAAQVRAASSGDTLDSARPADLLAVLDNLNRREAALRQEIADLQATPGQPRNRRLGGGAGGGAAPGWRRSRSRSGPFPRPDPG